MDSVKKFYDDLAGDYDLIFKDWDSSIRDQSNVMDKIIRNNSGQSIHDLKVLDCSCGIGTQAIGLALLGYDVHATDLSPEAVSRAQREAQRLGAKLTFGVADFRTLNQIEGKYNIVLSCDNSLPHLLSELDMLTALNSIYDKLSSGGLFFASIRDYDQLLKEKPQATFPAVYDDTKGKRVVLQLWDWEKDNNIYTLEHLIIRKYKNEWRTCSRLTKYRAILRSELSRLLLETGFTDVNWRMPDETGYYQPLVTARKI